MTYCSVHSHKTGKRCSNEDWEHKGRHTFDQLCICGIHFCIGRNKRIIKAIQRQKVVA